MSKYSGIIANEKTREAYMMGWQDGLETFGEGKLLGAKEERGRIRNQIMDMYNSSLPEAYNEAIRRMWQALSGTLEGLEG